MNGWSRKFANDFAVLAKTWVPASAGPKLARKLNETKLDLIQPAPNSIMISTRTHAHASRFERDLIRERTGEGRKRAMAAGIKFGRPRKLSDYHNSTF